MFSYKSFMVVMHTAGPIYIVYNWETIIQLNIVGKNPNYSKWRENSYILGYFLFVYKMYIVNVYCFLTPVDKQNLFPYNVNDFYLMRQYKTFFCLMHWLWKSIECFLIDAVLCCTVWFVI